MMVFGKPSISHRSRPIACAFLLWSLASQLAATTSTEPAPIVVEPSQYWEGNDGPWSTFSIRLGNPPQIVRLLVSTAFPNAVVVLNESCSAGPQSQCATDRGGIYAPNSSTTYKNEGIFNLYAELNYTTQYDRAYYGFDTLGFGLDSTGPTIEKQVVAAAETTDYYVGLLGIDLQPTNFSDFSNPYPSLFQTLKTDNMIPSLTYSYTAGAKYRLKQVLGSLVFGGYDSSRFTPNDVTFQFASDVSRDLVVGIQSITSTAANGASKELLGTSGILAFVDSTTPYIVLPLAACLQFENAFALEWNATAELYLVSDSLHNGLLASNPNITFTIGDLTTGTTGVSITLPYAAFDLMADSPLVSSPTRYFPLKRAANETQYTLGRTFLQESVLIADYERGNFSLYPCVWNVNAQEHIEVIHSLSYVAPPVSGSNGTDTSSSNSPSNNTLAIGVGVGVGCGILLLIGGFLAIAWFKRVWPFHRRFKGTELDSSDVILGPDGRRLEKSPANAVEAEADAKHNYFRPELVGSDGNIHKSELVGSYGAANKTELPGMAVYRPGESNSRGELVGSDAVNEVEGSSVLMELPGSPVSTEYLGRNPHESVGGTTLSPDSPRRYSTQRDSPNSPLLGSSRGPAGPASPLSEVTSVMEDERMSFLQSPVSNASGEQRAGDRRASDRRASDRSRSAARARERGSESSRRPSVSPAGYGDESVLRVDHEPVSRDPSRDRRRGSPAEQGRAGNEPADGYF